ncbi:hypothetical protein CKO23_23225 [Thiocystis violacea]|nr:hypothetical protein [Thiocystis violacea]
MFMAATRFLKKPERIMALMMVMTLCLLVYAALVEHVEQIVLHVEQHHSVLLQLLGPRYVAIYSASG